MKTHPFMPTHFVPLVLWENSRNRSYPNEAAKSVTKTNSYNIQPVPKQNIVTA